MITLGLEPFALPYCRGGATLGCRRYPTFLRVMAVLLLCSEPLEPFDFAGP